jgi:calcineurin-like phosphoesterase family protein
MENKKLIFNKNNLFFTSDTHFYHNNILKYDNRPFVSIEEMNSKIIENWNSIVLKDDIVFHLGDFAFTNISNMKNILSQLNGDIYYVLGNHDDKKIFNKLSDRFKLISNYLEIFVKEDTYGQVIVLSHYPFLEWNKKHIKSWNLHGHCHGTLQYKQNYQLDVGICNNNYFPISYNQIKQNIQCQKFIN